MNKLNLISPEQSKQLEMRYLTSQLGNLFGLLVFIIITFGIAALPFKNKLEEIKASNQDFINSATARHNILTNDIRAFNINLDNLDKISSSFYDWHKLFAALPSLKPENIFLSEINASIASNRTIIIKGFAQTREDLITFQNNLSNSEFFETIRSPLSNYTSSQKINFEISALLK